MEQALGRLNPRGRILLFFGSSGNIDYLARLIEREGFLWETLAARVLAKDNLTVTYTTQRLTR
jgi:release factor glutamine methyltransferase